MTATLVQMGSVEAPTQLPSSSRTTNKIATYTWINIYSCRYRLTVMWIVTDVDLDSDNDGIYDVVEACTNGDGMIVAGFVDANAAHISTDSDTTADV